MHRRANNPIKISILKFENLYDKVDEKQLHF